MEPACTHCNPPGVVISRELGCGRREAARHGSCADRARLQPRGGPPTGRVARRYPGGIVRSPLFPGQRGRGNPRAPEGSPSPRLACCAPVQGSLPPRSVVSEHVSFCGVVRQLVHAECRTEPIITDTPFARPHKPVRCKELGVVSSCHSEEDTTRLGLPSSDRPCSRRSKQPSSRLPELSLGMPFAIWCGSAMARILAGFLPPKVSNGRPRPLTSPGITPRDYPAHLASRRPASSWSLPALAISSELGSAQ